MKSLIQYITENDRNIMSYLGFGGKNVSNNEGIIRFIYTDNVDYPQYSNHYPIEKGNSIIFRNKNKEYIIIRPMTHKADTIGVIDGILKGAKKIKSINKTISSEASVRGVIGKSSEITINVDVYEIDPTDVDWNKLKKDSQKLNVKISKTPYGDLALDRALVWDMFK